MYTWILLKSFQESVNCTNKNNCSLVKAGRLQYLVISNLCHINMMKLDVDQGQRIGSSGTVAKCCKAILFSLHRLRWRVLWYNQSSYMWSLKYWSCICAVSHINFEGAIIFISLNWKRYTRVLLPEASFGLQALSLPASVCVSVCVCVCINHLLVSVITRDPFKLASANLDQSCKRTCLRFLLFWGAINSFHRCGRP